MTAPETREAAHVARRAGRTGTPATRVRGIVLDATLDQCIAAAVERLAARLDVLAQETAA